MGGAKKTRGGWRNQTTDSVDEDDRGPADKTPPTVLTRPDFSYDKLPPYAEGRFIRLVEVLPELSEVGCVQCLLHEVRFGDSTSTYETLSYCWGTASEVHSILCNGQALEITQTLHRALHALRLPDKSRLMWIDQICINQKDDAEKTSQVAMMRDIYQRSSRTIAWLGDATNETSVALKAAHRIALAALSDAFAEAMSGRYEGSTAETLRQMLVERRGGWGEAKPSRSEYAAMSVLLRQPWFARMWGEMNDQADVQHTDADAIPVIQEVGVSETVVLQCGEAQLDFDELTWAVSIALVATTERNASASLGSFSQLTFLSWIRQQKRSDPGFSLPRLLQAAQTFGMTDPRDKFYALYGLTTTDISSLELQADYSAPADWVYMRAVKTLIVDAGHLQLLELVDKSSTKLPHLPSWVPSFEASWPNVMPLAESDSWWVTLTLGDKMRRQIGRLAVEARNADMEGLDEADREDVADQVAKIELTEDEVDEPSLFAASKGSSLGTFELEGSGALRLTGQLVDKVDQTSPALEARVMDAGDYATAINDADTIGEVLKAFGGVSRSTYRRVRSYAEALTERDEMVMARRRTTYPTGEPLLTAYRKTLTAGSTTLEDDDAEQVFAEWRRIFKPTSQLSHLGGSNRISGALKIAGLAIGGQTVTRQTRVFFAMTERSYGRRLSWTAKGYLALLPEAAVPGDLIVILRGGRLPFVIRPVQDGHRLIGPAYVHGIMNGEAFDKDLCGDIRLV